MLADSDPTVVEEAWTLIFNLWLKITDESDFDQNLIPIGLEYKELTVEFGKRINELFVRDQITDFYLKNRLRVLALKIKQARDNSTGKATTSRKKSGKTRKIFISYSHKDEKYKDELVSFLSPLQDEGIIEIWHDRVIAPGDDWYRSIQEAMNICDLSLLLISVDFLTSRFIQDEELLRLFERRKKEGLRIVPIIIRPCLWHRNSVLKKIQALPKDGKPISLFIDRDQIWTEIGMDIEKLLTTFKD